MIKYSVVIVTYNRLLLLKECLECVLGQSVSFSDIIIIDNCSTDGTKEYLDCMKTEHTALRVFHMKDNLGGAGGFAFGLSQIDKTMDYVLIIDDDAMLDLNFLRNIQEHLTDGIMAYSGSVFSNGTVDTLHRKRLVERVFLKRSDIPKEQYSGAYFDYDLSTFCGLLISVRLIRKVGLPKSDYFIWYDDTEYSLRIRRYTKIRNINSAIIDHKVGLSDNTQLNWKSYYGYRNMWDLGVRYSACPSLYNIYKVNFHIIKMLICICNILLKRKKKYNRYILRMHVDVLKFSVNRKLGINEKYMPYK